MTLLYERVGLGLGHVRERNEGAWVWERKNDQRSWVGDDNF